MHDAIDAGLYDPTAMVLSTVSAAGAPSSRMVLCKGVESDGVTFYSHYGSAKGTDLAANGSCALLFPCDAYFATRPRPSQLAAWASEQSAEVASREALEAAYDEAARRFEGGEVPRPESWGGYLVTPVLVELWQGRPGRLHDRLRYRRTDAGWTLARLAP
jgi:pyridoxamine 5'-phosphate oxidase